MVKGITTPINVCTKPLLPVASRQRTVESAAQRGLIRGLIDGYYDRLSLISNRRAERFEKPIARTGRGGLPVAIRANGVITVADAAHDRIGPCTILDNGVLVLVGSAHVSLEHVSLMPIPSLALSNPVKQMS
jgi:hypothetical protein